MTGPTDAVLRALSEKGLLLQQDKRLPNVVTLITGETLRSSWWSHPKGRVIYAALTELADHPDVLFAKLLETKVTLIHRRLWSAFLTVVTAGEDWQLRGLSSAAQDVLASANDSKTPVAYSGKVVKELEARLLVHTQQVHTETGRHELVIQSWPAWARGAKVKPLRSVAAARKQIEDATKAIGAELTALPWTTH